MIKKQMESVGRLHWIERVNNPVPGLWTLYGFGLDKGPDNQGFGPTLLADIELDDWTAAAILLCFCHQLHIQDGGLLATVDAFKWHDDLCSFEVTYSSGVKTICNTWRGCGTHTRLFDAVADMFGTAVAQLFKLIISRCLTGRWAAWQAVEIKIDLCSLYLGPAFTRLFKRKHRCSRTMCLWEKMKVGPRWSAGGEA